MHQRETARAAWSAAGLTHADDAGLRRFFKDFDAMPERCWPELMPLVRNKYDAYLERLAMPLWESGDVLLRLNLIRHLDPAHKAELTLMQRLTDGLDNHQHRRELLGVVERGSEALLRRVLKRKGLPDSLRLLAQQTQAERE
jgi:hypothetical protein